MFSSSFRLVSVCQGSGAQVRGYEEVVRKRERIQ